MRSRFHNVTIGVGRKAKFHGQLFFGPLPGLVPLQRCGFLAICVEFLPRSGKPRPMPHYYFITPDSHARLSGNTGAGGFHPYPSSQTLHPTASLGRTEPHTKLKLSMVLKMVPLEGQLIPIPFNSFCGTVVGILCDCSGGFL